MRPDGRRRVQASNLGAPMHIDLSGKTAIVTGSAAGIGLGVAKDGGVIDSLQ